MRGGLWAVLVILAVGITTAVYGQDPPRERPRVEGRVVNQRNEPISGADIYWCPTEAFVESRDNTVHATADQAGRFQLEAPEDFRVGADWDRIGRLWVVAKDHALEGVPANDYRVQPGKARKESIGLSPSARFTLRVVDPVRRAREGELVEPVHFVVLEPSLQGVNRLQTGLPRSLRERLAGVTDANGEYQVDYLKRGGSIAFRVVSEKYGVQEEGSSEERGTVPVVTFRLRPTARIEGSTIGDNKRAFAGMRLSFWTYAPDVPDDNPAEVTRLSFRASAVVGEDGRFEVPALGPGILSVAPERSFGIMERFDPLKAPVITAPPDVAAEMTAVVTLAPESTTVFRGVVVTEGTNEPVANVYVRISGGKGRNEVVAQTNARGEYSLTSISTDSSLTATAGVVQSRDVVKVHSSPGLKEVVCPPIKLPPTRKISGRLVDSGGKPVVDAEVVGLEVAIHHGQAKTLEDGRFEMMTAAEKTITDYIVRLNGQSREVTIRSREPLELVLKDAEKK